MKRTNRYKIIKSDAFGEQVSLLISANSNNFNRNITILAVSFATAESLILDNINKYDNMIILIYWPNKMYTYYYKKYQHQSCPNCLIKAINRNLDNKGPNYHEITSYETLLSETIVFKPEILMYSLLIGLSHIDNNTEWFLNGSKVIVSLLDNLNIEIENLFIEPDCSICNKDVSSIISLSNSISENVLNPLSPTRNYPVEYYQELAKDVCGKSIGFVRDISYDLQLPIASCSATLIFDQYKHELTLGRGKRFNDCHNIATIEALERLAGLKESYGMEIIKDTFYNLGDKVIDPRQYCLHTDEQYNIDKFPFEKFQYNLELPWIKGVDLINNNEVYVCASMVFYGSKYTRQFKMLAFESSNGCAVGSTYTEAILAALFEIIERDSFLYTWYKRKACSNITNFILEDNDIDLMRNKIMMFSNIDIQFYNSTMDYGVPSIFALAYSDRKDMPAFAAAAGTGINYYEAAKSALNELSCHYVRLQYLFSKKDINAKAMHMLQDSNKVKTMEDHGIVNALPEAYNRFDFLIESKVKFKTHDLKCQEITEAKTPAQTLSVLIDKFKKYNFNIIVVDQTPIFMRKRNLYCVKVLVSNMLPITFGHIYSRINSYRLLNSNNSILEFSSLYPHPFP